MYTRYQSGYIAHALLLEGIAEEALTQTIASAKVDMNPHQVDAAMFALASPLSNGVILADEVGLGKTIEASLVLAQKWAEHKRRLLLVVPATLRKQWSQELVEKFSLPSRILEARNFKEAQAAGAANPFLTESAFGEAAVVICSDEFASRKQAELATIPWDLVVFDEAHKLRNFYKGESAKIASRLDAALKGRPKLLLSATPLQNNLQELYGLIAIIDPHFFGNLDAFKARYCRPKLESAEFEQLRDRLKTICKRTLRRQVQETGGIKFTRRYSMTEDFRPSPDELELYRQVSEYLQDDNILSIKPGARHLVTLVIRKILASSSFAIQGTLTTMIERLEKKLPLADALNDYDAIADLTDEDDIVDPAALAAEVNQLKNFRSLAEHISRDAKADALLRVIGKAFDFAERLGGKRKAVIFTESVRTQSQLKQLLEDNGHAGKIAILNGSNADPDSKAIVNAVAHRDYSMHGARIRLHLFADRLELSTPGGLPNSLSIDSMEANSITRNETLVNLLSRYYPADPVSKRQNLIERRGEGVPTILAASQRLSLRRPLYEQIDHTELKLTIYAASREKNGLVAQFAAE